MKFTERAKLNLSDVNKEVLEQWKAENTFHKSIEEREGCPQFIFFEGPPSANGHPGIHHVLARSLKDTFCRFKTMKGFQVKRKAGWDTHGLPVELSVEKELGITKEDIGKTISIEDYNQKCRENVMMYTNEWADLSTRWVIGLTWKTHTSPTTTNTSNRSGGFSSNSIRKTCSTKATPSSLILQQQAQDFQVTNSTNPAATEM